MHAVLLLGSIQKQRTPTLMLCLSFTTNMTIFKACCYSNDGDDMSEDGFYVRRVRPGDEEGEPGIDGMASDFIARFYAARVSDPERQALAL
ncbi:unnamed protein product [Dovyalis caffra]|uniref:Uncharacterized protein n=1 Tax=Dovyalis caffra TaxID=77055 RepID=A0AAV1R2C0_9ROSI|nr:unnamed protein product [Dovyalis caffra]